MKIREFEPSTDRAGVRRCFVELQEVERALDPQIPAGEEIADAYLVLMFERCAEFGGVVLVAESGGEVAGFVTVLTGYRSKEPDDDPAPFAYVSDLVVLEMHRGRGAGRALLHAAESRAREAGAPRLGLSVKAGNDPALALYAAEGFTPVELELSKPLDSGATDRPEHERTPGARR